VGTAVVAFALFRRRAVRWGATDHELHQPLPGDELIAAADVQSTRAITIRAAAEQVWPWIAQLGQGRGGFYSYDALENLVGCDIHSADSVVPEWQRVEVGDQIRLAPDLPLTVARVDQGEALVVRGGVPMGPKAPPYDFTWAFVVREAADGSTRLVVRERYGYCRWWAALIVQPTQLVSFLMSRRMLRGIARRAESSAFPMPTPTQESPVT
jgi:hypothetical protein